MQIDISADVFSRFGKLAKNSEKYPVYFEEKNNKRFILATNKRVVCVQFLAEGYGIDQNAAIVPNQQLIEQCDIERNFSSVVKFTSSDQMKYTTVKTQMGFTVADNLFSEIPEHFENWRTWFPEQVATKTKGVMFCNLDNLILIASCSPSGRVVFPARINTEIPVVLRDVHDPNWMGAFLPIEENGEKFDPAEVAEWIND